MTFIKHLMRTEFKPHVSFFLFLLPILLGACMDTKSDNSRERTEGESRVSHDSISAVGFTEANKSQAGKSGFLFTSAWDATGQASDSLLNSLATPHGELLFSRAEGWQNSTAFEVKRRVAREVKVFFPANGMENFFGVELEMAYPEIVAPGLAKGFREFNAQVKELAARKFKAQIDGVLNAGYKEASAQEWAGKQVDYSKFYTAEFYSVYFHELADDTLLSVDCIGTDFPDDEENGLRLSTPYTYSFKQKAFLRFDDVFLPTLEQEITAFLLDNINQQRRLNGVDTIAEEELYGRHLIPLQWEFAPSGVTFLNLPGEQGYGYKATMEIYVPYKELQRYLKPGIVLKEGK
jgi:hypothetical protein